jgi:hypothetical protein
MTGSSSGNNRHNERERALSRMRSINNYAMGIILILAGFFFMFPMRYSAEFLDRYDPVLIRIFAVVCWVYGAFRLYRGYQKNHFDN